MTERSIPATICSSSVTCSERTKSIRNQTEFENRRGNARRFFFLRKSAFLGILRTRALLSPHIGRIFRLLFASVCGTLFFGGQTRAARRISKISSGFCRKKQFPHLTIHVRRAIIINDLCIFQSGNLNTRSKDAPEPNGVPLF